MLIGGAFAAWAAEPAILTYINIRYKIYPF